MIILVAHVIKELEGAWKHRRGTAQSVVYYTSACGAIGVSSSQLSLVHPF